MGLKCIGGRAEGRDGRIFGGELDYHEIFLKMFNVVETLAKERVESASRPAVTSWPPAHIYQRKCREVATGGGGGGGNRHEPVAEASINVGDLARGASAWLARQAVPSTRADAKTTAHMENLSFDPQVLLGKFKTFVNDTPWVHAEEIAEATKQEAWVVVGAALAILTLLIFTGGTMIDILIMK
jgi:hypothetical protein